MRARARTRVITLGVGLWILMHAAGATAQSLGDDPAFALYRQAIDAFERKEYDRASAVAKEAISHYPDHLTAHYLLGQVALAHEKWEEAVTAFTRVVSLSPTSFAGHREMGIALAQLNRTDEAIHAFQAALRLRPESEDVLARLAFLYLQAGKKDQALPLLKGLADRGTKEPEAWYALGRLSYDRNDFAASEKAFSQAVALRDDGKTWFNLGVVRLRLQDPQGALQAFERAARNPELREEATRQINQIRKIHDHHKALEPPR